MRAEDFLAATDHAEPLLDKRIEWHDPHYKYDSHIVVEPIAPTWRDIWAIFRKRYEPKVRMYRRLTFKGQNQCLKDVWTTPKLEEQLYKADSFLTAPEAKVPLHRRAS